MKAVLALCGAGACGCSEVLKRAQSYRRELDGLAVTTLLCPLPS